MADCVLLGQLQMVLHSQFVRDVAVFPEPTIVVATDRQLHDLVRFCTADDVFSVVSIDSTYEHGEYFVTPISHKHLMLKSNRTGKKPVRVGPVLLHMSKNLHPYYQFAVENEKALNISNLLVQTAKSTFSKAFHWIMLASGLGARILLAFIRVSMGHTLF